VERELEAMTDDLEPLLTKLRVRPVLRRLDQLEPAVWRRIDDVRVDQAQVRNWRWQAGLAAVILTFGAFAGGVAAARPETDSSPFAVHAAYAPSTLLGEHR
jgi:hypothetical protein